MSTDKCACCGAEIPEGRQICWQCEHQFDDNKQLFKKFNIDTEEDCYESND